ncbi:DUF4174 domain-containing protein [Paracoccus caeni]|uniref:DUF4174 domain-containing protein n=1 Tax=Paracoccus caeni TaxID=657651 RepID=A0A934VZ41_9RHOB|nr:DUF4174 domain-containing protein [Paracoccus caeni]MBK4215430.1 DUF4174 domain-containing protein [Paracoccus caeni]
MKLKLLIFVMALAAMGPSRDAPPPDADSIASATQEEAQPMSPEEVPGATAPEVERPELQILDASEAEPGAFMWEMRPVIVFADTPGDPAFREQMRMLEAGADALIERDVVVITDADPAANSAWRRQLHPRGFSLVIMDKDGQVKQRKPFPWDVREIGRAIDRFPLRRQEIGRAGVLQR